MQTPNLDRIDRQELERFGSLELLARQVVEGFIVGLHKSPFHGFSVEFAEHRLYNPGESTRHMDWKLFGRTDKLFLKRYEEETNLRCHLVVDASSSMHYGQGNWSKLRFSAYSAACIAYLLHRQRDAAGLTIFTDAIKTFLPARSSGAHQKLIFNELTALLGQQPLNQPTHIGPVLHQLAESVHRRALVVIFSDMLADPARLDETLGGLQHLRYKGHEVMVFHTLDAAHENLLEFENRPYKFVDMETGQTLKLNPTEMKAQYIQRMAEYNQELKLKLSQYRIDYVPADINAGFRGVLLQYLAKRKKVG